MIRPASFNRATRSSQRELHGSKADASSMRPADAFENADDIARAVIAFRSMRRYVKIMGRELQVTRPTMPSPRCCRIIVLFIIAAFNDERDYEAEAG